MVKHQSLDRFKLSHEVIGHVDILIMVKLQIPVLTYLLPLRNSVASKFQNNKLSTTSDAEDLRLAKRSIFKAEQ